MITKDINGNNLRGSSGLLLTSDNQTIAVQRNGTVYDVLGEIYSTDYDIAVMTSPRQWQVAIYHNGTLLDCAVSRLEVSKGSCGSSESFSLGNIYSSLLTAELLELNTNIKGEDIEVRIGLYVNNSWVWITLGWFTAIEVTKTAYSTNVTGYGFSTSKTGVSFTVPSTLSLANIATAIATATGLTVTFDSSITTSYELAGTLDTMSCYEGLQVLAHAVGGYAVDTNDGNIKIYQFSDTPTLEVTTDRMLSLPNVEETDFEVTGVQVLVTRADDEADPPIPEVSYTYGSPVVLYDENENMSADIFNNVYENIVGYSYYTGKIDLSIGDPRIEGNDVLTVNDVNGNTYTVPCHMVTHTYDGGLSTYIEAVKATTDADGIFSVAPITQRMDELGVSVSIAKASAETAYNSAMSAQQSAEKAEQTADYIDQATYGTITYEYDNGGTIETVYKRSDGTYYYLDSGDNEVDVDEADLVHVDGELVTNRQDDGLDTLVANARQDAQDASDYANSAQNSANSALVQLSEVEKVVDVLTWVSEHGQYSATGDTEVLTGKYYFTATFTLTTDTTIDQTKTYYTYSGGVYEIVENPDVAYINTYYEGDFDVVNNPTGNPSTQGWYELSSVNEAVSNYIATHLALTDSGLYVQMDDSTSKIQIASDGVYLWNSTGVIAKYGSDVTLGDVNDLHIVLSSGELGFYQASAKVAYINTNKLFITSAEITNELRIGNFVWKPRNGRLTLMYSPVS